MTLVDSGSIAPPASDSVRVALYGAALPCPIAGLGAAIGCGTEPIGGGEVGYGPGGGRLGWTRVAERSRPSEPMTKRLMRIGRAPGMDSVRGWAMAALLG